MGSIASADKPTANDINSLSVQYTNSRSLVPKLDDVTDLLSVTDSDIIALAETWLAPQINDSEVRNFAPHFDIYRYERSLGRAEGILIGTKRLLS